MTAAVMHDGLTSAAERFPDHPGVLAGDQRWTFAQLDHAANALAKALGAKGVGRGDRVAVLTSNRPEFVVAVHALSKLGAASVMMSTAWKRREVEQAVGLTEPCFGIADGPGAALLAASLNHEVLDLDVDGVPIRDAGPCPAPPPVTTEDDDAVLVFSSGTTGQPKAVRHTHRSLCCATRHWCRALGLGPADRFQVATPPSHILGLLNLLAAAAAGATVRLHRRFDLDEVLRRIQDERMTLEMAVAPIALAMANHPRLEDYDLSSLRYIMWGATPVTPSVAERVTARTGVRWLPAYGASEVPVITANPVDHPDAWRLDSVGLAQGDIELRVADLDDGAVLAPGRVGELQVRSASAMAGYLPEEDNTSAWADGWYRTGDVGWIEPEGWVHLTDRCKEMIKVSGFQVAPAEIEAVLHQHSAVVDCAVFAIPDDRTGEAPVAAVALTAEGVEVGELQSLVAESLATYKQLRQIVVVETIPRLPSGKVLRRVLQDEWVPRLSAARELSSAPEN
jgi:long-chain acyl-CoA synthetase